MADPECEALVRKVSYKPSLSHPYKVDMAGWTGLCRGAGSYCVSSIVSGWPVGIRQRLSFTRPLDC